jgi:hypothetical protein
LGAKVNIQKQDHQNRKKKMLGQKATVQGENVGEEEDDKEEGDQEVEEDKAQAEDDSIPENERIKSNLKNSSKIYYSITHTVQEEIKEQPKMIKGGNLKSY